jgi:hypothetical protein
VYVDFRDGKHDRPIARNGIAEAHVPVGLATNPRLESIGFGYEADASMLGAYGSVGIAPDSNQRPVVAAAPPASSVSRTSRRVAMSMKSR